MIMMLVLAILVLAATQTYNTESRISSNDADKKLAMQYAEAALRDGENYIIDSGLNDRQQSVKFTSNCNQGLCSVETVPAWERDCGGKNCLDQQGRQYHIQGVNKSPRYIIEWINSNDDDIIFR
ncbi:MAG: PilX N-terminal domain-containing pilus assembly protein, partial [Neisseria sp.]|nr:PilX N-terminal domain-containing pilus assembly protein [Neisseria sp.]